MTDTTPTLFTGHSELWQVLADPRGKALVDYYLPGLTEANLLHTLHTYPLRLIAATDSRLGADPDALCDFLDAVERIPAYHENASASADLAAEPVRRRDDGPRGSAAWAASSTVTRFRRFEVALHGPSTGNPYTQVRLEATVTGPSGAVTIPGFYDGDGVYRMRYLPEATGEFRFTTRSNVASLDAITGVFTVEAARPSDHGPVRVADTYHFAHADGTRHLPIGTTAYVWNHQGDAREEQTLATLADAPFNKIRMCVFPKSYLFNENEPDLYPFEGDPENGFDFDRPAPAYWRHLEHRIEQLDELGIQADLILFHGYDRWGFATMDPLHDDRYVAYAVARLAAFPNIWWALANEYDLLFTKTEEDWERLAGVITRNDSSRHLLSIHNCRDFYDHSRPWISHASIQRRDVYRTAENTDEWRREWGKPVVIDECAYEGNIDQGWGNITGEEMTRRFWEGAVRGGYVGHGETYVDPEDVLWWSKGGVLKGSSPDRIRFLRSILEQAPGPIEPLPLEWDVPRGGIENEYYLYYFGFEQPAYRRFILDPAVSYTVDVIDTWNMTTERQPGEYRGRFEIELPGRPYVAVRLQAVQC